MSGITPILKNIATDVAFTFEVNTFTVNNIYVHIDVDVGGLLVIKTKVHKDLTPVQISSTVIADATPALVSLIDVVATHVEVTFTPTGASVGKLALSGK